jgi:hypothetical protein
MAFAKGEVTLFLKEKRMKKKLLISILMLLVFTFCTSDAFAREKCRKSYESPNNIVTFSFFIHPLSVGYKHRLNGNVFLTGNVDYVGDESELLLQLGAAYMLPRKILFFRFYGGGGLEMSRNYGTLYPYLMAGTKFFFLYAEIVHPLENNRTPGYRFGFSFSF